MMATSWPRFRRYGPLSILALIGVGLGADAGPGSAVAEGESLYARGDFAAALAAFKRASNVAPGSAIPLYDQGAALFQLGRYAEAAERYVDAFRTADPPLRAKIDYAMGNVSVALGQYKEALDHYDACIASPRDRPGADRGPARRPLEPRVRRQARPSPSSPDPEGNRKTQGDSPKPSAPKDGGDEPPKAPDAKSPPPPGAGDTSKSGGGGGSSPPPPASPESELNKLLDDIRQARRQRLDPPPPPAPKGDVKDW